MYLRSRLLVVIGIILYLSISYLYANQPFWSMEPSSYEIERADSLTGFDITKYIISLEINDQNHSISGSVEAFVYAEEALSSISYRLMGGNLSVSQVRVNDVPQAFTHVDGVINIPLNIPQGASFTTKVYYAGIPGNSPAPYNIGLKWTTNGCYTLSNPDAGRYYWPSYDHPWDKALVDWHLTVRGDWLAIANGVRTGITTNDNGTRTHHWVSSNPIATYVMGFAAAPYVEFSQMAGDIPIKNYVLQGQMNNAMIDFANVPEMIAHFSSLFGAYPFDKYGHMVVSMSTYAAMEHQESTTYGAQYLNGMQTYESIVAHELAHQWYGNYVTPITMREVWLKESFATYSEMLWTHHKLGWQSACDYLRDSIQQYYISWENSNGPHTIFNPEYNLMFAPPTYEKSASVLHMLRLKMGNTAFFNFIRAIINTYGNSNINTAEFVALAQQHSGQDLTQFFNQWIFSPGIPNASVAVFKNATGQAKTYGFSTSPTATQFILDIPLKIGTGAAADSVVVSASPTGAISYFNYTPTNDITGVLIDPNHWVLTRQISQIQMQLLSALPYNGAVALNWASFNALIPVSGYNVYRRVLPDGVFQRINQVLINGTAFTDSQVMNGTDYEYYVCAVDNESYETLPSNALQAMPISFPFDSGFLVVDETRDGNGSAISPNDQMADDFYAYVLQSYEFTQWDYAAQGAPSLAELSHYPLVLWHCDDFSEQMLLDNLALIGSYVLSGGKIMISGWKYPSVFSDAFMQQFLPGVTRVYNNGAVLMSLQSDIYPDLYPDPAKLAGSWNGMLPMTYSFTGVEQSLYNVEIAAGGTGNGNSAGLRIDLGGSLVLLGVPLYFMQQDAVRGFLTQYLYELYPELDAAEQEITQLQLIISVSPNPFTEALSVRIEASQNEQPTLELFNIRGQRLGVFSPQETAKGRYSLDINLTSVNGIHLPRGIYLLKVMQGKQSALRKIIKY